MGCPAGHGARLFLGYAYLRYDAFLKPDDRRERWPMRIWSVNGNGPSCIVAGPPIIEQIEGDVRKRLTFGFSPKALGEAPPIAKDFHASP